MKIKQLCLLDFSCVAELRDLKFWSLLSRSTRNVWHLDFWIYLIKEQKTPVSLHKSCTVSVVFMKTAPTSHPLQCCQDLKSVAVSSLFCFLFSKLTFWLFLFSLTGLCGLRCERVWAEHKHLPEWKLWEHQGLLHLPLWNGLLRAQGNHGVHRWVSTCARREFCCQSKTAQLSRWSSRTLLSREWEGVDVATVYPFASPLIKVEHYVMVGRLLQSQQNL